MSPSFLGIQMKHNRLGWSDDIQQSVSLGIVIEDKKFLQHYISNPGGLNTDEVCSIQRLVILHINLEWIDQKQDTFNSSKLNELRPSTLLIPAIE